MGQDHMGDIRLLSEIARPRIAVLTLVGEAHLEYFGSRDKIAQGKMQIVDGMNSDGILIAPEIRLLTHIFQKIRWLSVLEISRKLTLLVFKKTKIA